MSLLRTHLPWIPDALADRLDWPSAPRAIEIVVFGSTGGGDLYAIDIETGRILRLQGASYLAGVYEGTDRGITVVGRDLRDFLDRVLAAVV
ncbi:hypothetical protein [Cryptosporangium japonicum]|uniref:Knr4/Smi1-like domain-containing protein n=1 Tax=Cryptosporangium japonicum TaxID=80872 RepID=A0ABN0TS20_9ACTN